VYCLLEGAGFELMLVNAQDAVGLPGRKSDVSDTGWLWQLPECGLLRSSQPQSSTGVYRCGRSVQLRHDFV
jgi:transposase